MTNLPAVRKCDPAECGLVTGKYEQVINDKAILVRVVLTRCLVCERAWTDFDRSHERK